jgi:flagellar hook protein FlgE
MASLFGALDTAVSGLTAQSVAFGNISDNIANSQTVGFKGTNTSFADYLSTSSQITNDSGAVLARPEYENQLQGTITASTDPLALAISGQGFFQVSQQSGTGVGTTLSTTPEYSRDGDFNLDTNGFLVNGSDQVLNGWLADPTTGVINTSQQLPIQINRDPIAPTPTANVNLSANLPASPTTATTPSQINVYDAQGVAHTVDLNYTQTSAGTWTVNFTAPDAATTNLGSAQLQFGPTVSGNPVNTGTLASLSNATGTVTTTTYAANSPATVSFSVNYGSGPQTINLNLGNFGSSTGLTQYAGTTYSPTSLTQDGLPPGNYSSVATQSNGNVVVSYDNGQSKIVAQVPIVQFANANGLQRQDGQGFTATPASGAALVQAIGNSGSTLATGSVEASNVDIATEFTKLIVAQQAYAANSKVITTADDMLTQTINMKR